MTIDRLTIIGFGLLGASIARAVRISEIKCSKITAFDHDLSDAAGWIKSNVIDEFIDDERLLAAELSQSDWVIICLPPESSIRCLGTIAGQLKSEAIITDVTSTKRSICDESARTLPNPERFVGGHPMAGGERGGRSSSSATLFQNAAVVLTPTSRTDADVLLQVQEFWMLLGGQVIEMSPEMHDRRVAMTSHLPHALASLLMHVTSSDDRLVAGAGFADLTRIAAGDPVLWRQILTDNADQVRAALADVAEALNRLDTLLAPGNEQRLELWLADAANTRRQLSDRKISGR